MSEEKREVEEALEPYWSNNPVWRGADIGDGWGQLVIDLVKDLAAIAPDFKVVQVKEKFGGLRFYTEGYPLDYEGQSIRESKFYQRIAEAESLSFKMCEVCGEEGSSEGSQGWIRTLCETHRNEARRP